uniref:Putative ovule protein n=1 Tax=Solanum chacoense TaxID=4108 RepID=A0A0V0H4U7_SOLCH
MNNLVMILHKATKANIRHLTDTNNKNLLDAFQWNTLLHLQKTELLKYELVRHLKLISLWIWFSIIHWRRCKVLRSVVSFKQFSLMFSVLGIQLLKSFSNTKFSHLTCSSEFSFTE